MIHKIKLSSCNCTIRVDDAVDLETMQEKCPVFFLTGREETYTVHNGGLIVDTMDYAARPPVRRIGAWLFLPKGYPDSKRPDMKCISAGCNLRSVGDGEALIDRILEEKRHDYGMQPYAEIDA